MVGDNRRTQALRPPRMRSDTPACPAHAGPGQPRLMFSGLILSLGAFTSARFTTSASRSSYSIWRRHPWRQLSPPSHAWAFYSVNIGMLPPLAELACCPPCQPVPATHLQLLYGVVVQLHLHMRLAVVEHDADAACHLQAQTPWADAPSGTADAHGWRAASSPACAQQPNVTFTRGSVLWSQACRKSRCAQPP